MFCHLLLENIRIKHLAALAVAFVLSILFTKPLEYEIIALWTINFKHHLNITWSPRYSEVYQPMVIPLETHLSPTEEALSAKMASLPLIIYDGANSTAFVLFEIPLNFPIKPEAKGRTRPSFLKQIKAINHKSLPNETFLTFIVEKRNNTLVYALSSILVNATAAVLNIRLIDSKFDVIWCHTLVVSSYSGIKSSLLIDQSCYALQRPKCGVLYAVYSELADAASLNIIALDLNTGNLLWNVRPYDTPNLSIMENKTNSFNYWRTWRMRMIENYVSTSTESDSTQCQNYQHVLVQMPPIEQYQHSSPHLMLLHVTPRDQPPSSDVSRLPHALAAISLDGMHLFHVETGNIICRMSFQLEPGFTYAHLPASGLRPNYPSDTAYEPEASTLYRLGVTSTIVPLGMLAHNPLTDGVRVEEEQQVPSEHLSGPSQQAQGAFSHTVDCRGVLQPVSDLLPSTVLVVKGLCRPHRLQEYARLGKPDWREDDRKVVPPLVLFRTHSANGDPLFWNHLHQPRLQKADSRSVYDIVFLTSDGSLTSVSSWGRETWRVNAEVSWLQLSRHASIKDGAEADELVDLYKHHFLPSLISADLTPMTHQASSLGLESVSLLHHTLSRLSGGLPAHSSPNLVHGIVATGWDSISLVDRVYGHLLATHRLPSPPVGRPTLLEPLSSALLVAEQTTTMMPSLILVHCDGLILAFGVTRSLRVITLVLAVIGLPSCFLLIRFVCDVTVSQEDNDE